jgi:hypothetical protein
MSEMLTIAVRDAERGYSVVTAYPRRPGRAVRLVLAGMVLAASWTVVGLAASVASEPYCPSEDSCRVDYSDGAWHVVEDRP